MRPSSRIERNWAKPRPCSPSRLALGTRTSENDSSRVSEAFQPTLEYFFDTVRPGVPAGTMIVEMLLPPSSRVPVTAVTVMTAVMSVPELVMNALVPLITHSSPSRRAVVSVPPASEPAPGSVSPNAPSDSPGAQRRQPRALLLLGAEPVDRHRAQRHGRLERDGYRGVDPGQLLDRDAEREIVAAHAAVLLAERQAEQPHLAHLAHDVVGEGVTLVEVADGGRDHVVGELLDGLAQRLELGGQLGHGDAPRTHDAGGNDGAVPLERRSGECVTGRHPCGPL